MSERVMEAERESLLLTVGWGTKRVYIYICANLEFFFFLSHLFHAYLAHYYLKSYLKSYVFCTQPAVQNYLKWDYLSLKNVFHIIYNIIKNRCVLNVFHFAHQPLKIFTLHNLVVWKLCFTWSYLKKFLHKQIKWGMKAFTLQNHDSLNNVMSFEL